MMVTGLDVKCLRAQVSDGIDWPCDQNKVVPNYTHKLVYNNPMNTIIPQKPVTSIDGA